MSQILDLLMQQHNGAHVININQAGAALGLKKQSTYNSIQKKTFPLPIVEVGGRRVVRLLDLANFLDGLTSARRPGRPSHKEREARRLAAEAAKRGLSVQELQAQSSLPCVDGVAR
jgi:predicted DNA-binding transcriptional regulator AlpA